MSNSLKHLIHSPMGVRILPFLVFIVITQMQSLGEGARYWAYLVKTLIGAGLLLWLRPFIAEMRWKLTWEALLVGIGVFIMWVGIDPYYPGMDQLFSRSKGAAGVPLTDTAASPWNPFLYFGAGSALAWFMVVVRILGSSLVVPFIEEIFYRSFLCRYILKPDFESVPLGFFQWMPFVVTSVLFGLTHSQWLAGILCGLIYQGLVCWKKRLDDVIAAHAVTNFLLGLYVLKMGAWQFW